MAADGTVLWKCGACEECFYDLTDLAGHKCIGNTGTITLSDHCIKQLDQPQFTTADIENTDQVEAISAIAALEEEEEEENSVTDFEHAVDHNASVTFATTVTNKRKAKPTIVSVNSLINPERKFKKHQKGKRSLVWAYFTALDCKKAMCCICEKVIAYCGTPTNLVYHLNRFHPSESEIVKSKHAGGAKYQYLENKIPKSNTFGRLKAGKTSSIKLPKRPIVSTVSVQRKSLADRIVELVATDLLPVHLVDGEGFKSFVQSFEPSSKVPDAKTVLKDLMPRRYYTESKRIKQLISSCHKVHISVELWNGYDNEYFLTVSSHFITDDFETRCYVLRTTCLGNEHTSHAIATTLLSSASDWGISSSILCIVSDGSENISKAILEFNMTDKHIICLAHTLDRIIKESFAASPELNKLIEKCRVLVRYLKQNSIASQKLIEIQTQNKQLQSIMRDHLDFADAKTPNCPLKAIKDVPGHWITVFHMLQRIFTLRNVINMVIDDTNSFSHSLSETDWLAIEETISLFKAFEVVTLELCSEHYPSLSKVIPIVQGLLSLINNCNSLTLDFVEKVRKDLLSKLRRRLGQVENNLTMAVATILDPRFKNIAFQSDIAVDAAVQNITSEGRKYRKVDHSYTDNSSKEIFDKNSSYTDSLWESFDKKATPRKEQAISDDAVNSEMKNYFDEPLIDRKKEPTLWWRDFGSTRFPILAEIAKKMLSIPSTSMPPERIFLQKEKAYLDRRKLIKTKYVDQFVFLSMNIE